MATKKAPAKKDEKGPGKKGKEDHQKEIAV